MEENKNDVLFGTAVFGGFNRKNVIDYIEKLQEERVASSSRADVHSQQAEAELEDAKAQIRSLTTALEHANAEKAELLEQLNQITELKAQLRVERTENKLLREKLRGKNIEDFPTETAYETVDETESVFAYTEEEQPDAQNNSLSLDDVDNMVQEIIH